MHRLLSDAVAALRTLDDEVDSDRDLLALMDNFEVIASAFDALLIPRRRWRILKAKPLTAVLKAIGKAKGDKELVKLAKSVKSQTKEIRAAEYGGFDGDTSDLIGEANDLREELKEALARLLPEPPDDPEDPE
jgi:hypothetical protein